MVFGRVLQHSTLIAVAVLIMCVLGISAALRVPVQMIPDLEVRTISVDTRWPGASPRDVEQDILIEQEQYLRSLPGLRRMVSTASTGQATIELEFPYGADINEALIRTNNALSQVSGYPENVDAPALTMTSSSNQPFMYFRVGPRAESGASLDLAMMRSFLEDEVRPRLERVDGVSLVEIRGAEERQVRIEVDPYRLAERGLDMSDIRNALRARNIDRSAGDLDSGKRGVLVRTVGRFREPADIGALIIAEHDGALLRLSDVADLQLSHHELRALSYYNGLPALILSVQRETGSNVVQTKNAMLPAVEAVNAEVLAPLGLEMTLVNEDARYVEDSVANVWNNLLLGTLLATLAMYSFLRSARSTFVGVIAIPICTIAAFIGLLLAGRTLNVISMAGVAFAIGMTLDNTIVVLESIDQARRRGLKPFEAAVEGVSRVWPAVLACTLTTVLVFAPTLFIQQEAGQLYSDIAIAISASILASMAVAVTVLPTMAARLLPGLTPAESAGGGAFDRIGRVIGKAYCTPTRRAAILLGTLCASVLAVVWLTPPAEYLPEGEEARVFSRMIAPPGYNLAEMEGIAQVLISELQQRLEDDPARFHRGETDVPAMRFFSMFVDAQGISVITDPKDPDDLQALMGALETRFTAWPGMRAFASRGSIISSNDGGTRSINLNISGTDLAQIYQVADRAYARAGILFDGAQVGSEPSSLSLDQSLLEVRPRWERLAEVGLDAERFGYSVAALSDGAFADEMILDDRRVDIYLFSSAGRGQRADLLRELPIATPSGAVVPLSALADLHEAADTDSIRRLDGRRTVTLNIVPPRSVALETGVERVRSELIEAMVAAGEIPHGIAMNITGASDQLQETREAVTGNFLIAILLCYLMLVAIFRHWGRPLFVMATIPLGLAGGIVGLAMLNGIGAAFGIHQPFDMITLLGFLVLLGAVVNNPILIIQEAYKRLEEGSESITSAVDDAVRIRLRAILMSSLTTILGVAPLVLIPGAGTELYRGLGAIVMFGIAFSTVVTLTFLPSLMVATLALQARVGARLASRLGGFRANG
ncbi:efflux RND transporter permease subunit [Stutzerimonas azotifigens]|uniref:Efflux RND transporter permease subunit n=1 Tax=Stutzerimonas azotifigens TaxID=291995 RepID=A0ABR5YZM8_9GAMM|nr:efflux RND transporter permease subunit [Stutzerimonas azotifigens]MBA1273374.1 efflux RND transporter permease subunit [Stutzerimonas azotifigens]